MKLTVGFLLSDLGCVSGLSSPVPLGIQGPRMGKGTVMFQVDDTRTGSLSGVSTWMTATTSRAPTTSGSYWTWALLVARLTEAATTPYVELSLDSILWTHEAQVIPVICRARFQGIFTVGIEKETCCGPTLRSSFPWVFAASSISVALNPKSSMSLATSVALMMSGSYLTSAFPAIRDTNTAAIPAGHSSASFNYRTWFVSTGL